MHKAYRKAPSWTLLLIGAGPLGCGCAMQPPGALSSELRLGYTATDNGTGNTVESLSVGARLDGTTPAWRNLRAGSTLYATTPVGGMNDDPLFLDSAGGPNGKGYAVFGQLWVEGHLGETRLRIGRQEIDTPFADTDDIGMIPNTFEGVVLSNNTFEDWEFTLAHLRRWAGVDARQEKFTRINGKRGLTLLGVNRSATHWDAQAWYYRQPDGTDIFYLEAGGDPIDNLHLRWQWTRQQDKAANQSAHAWGLSVAYTLDDFTLSGNYNRVSGSGSVSNGYGGGPFFTSCDQNTIDGTPRIRALALGAEYHGIDRLSLGVRHVDFDQGVGDEWDLWAGYSLSENLHFDLVHSDMGPDGNNTRAFINYRLTLL